MRVWRIAGVFAFSIAFTVVSTTQLGNSIERILGGNLLAEIASLRSAPDHAAIIAIDSASIEWLSRNADRLEFVAPDLYACLSPQSRALLRQSRSVHYLPRALHICVLERLMPEAPRLIVFDISFKASRSEDLVFADAIRRAGNVILLRSVRDEGDLVIISNPTFELAEASLDQAFFVIDGTAERAATGYFEALSEFPSARAMPEVVAERFSGRAYTSEGSRLRLLTYYGSPGTIPTISLRALFESSNSNNLGEVVSGRAVFIGVSDPTVRGSSDHFPMPGFTTKNPIGGVEIAATAFLNRLAGHELFRLPSSLEALLVFTMVGLVFGATLGIGGWLGIILSAVVGIGFIAGAKTAFSVNFVWLPVGLPILIGLPAAMIVGIISRYISARALVRAVVPLPIANRWLSKLNTTHNELEVEHVTVIFIDLAGSTALGEKLDATTFSEVLSCYYEGVAVAIEEHQGMIIDFMGDGVLAVFSDSVSGKDHADLACEASIEASIQIRRLGMARYPEYFNKMNVRFGLNSGPVSMGMMGGSKRYKYDILGDVVNTAQRIESFGSNFPIVNGSIILLSMDTQILRQRNHLIPSKSLGRHILKGRTEDTELLQLLMEGQL